MKPVRTGDAPAMMGFGRSIKAVAWSFLGVRKHSEYQEDLARVNPFYVIAIAVAGVFAFVVGLMVFVNWVVAK